MLRVSSAQVTMLGGERKSRRERRLAAADAIESEAEDAEQAAGRDAYSTPADDASEGSSDESRLSAVEHAQPKLQRNLRIADAVWQQREGSQPADRSLRMSGQSRVAMTGAEYRRHVAGAKPAARFGDGVMADFQRVKHSDDQRTASSEDTSKQAASAPASGWTLASLWQSVTKMNSRKQLKHRSAKA